MTALRDLIGTELEPTGWLEVTQARIDDFARAWPSALLWAS